MRFPVLANGSLQVFVVVPKLAVLLSVKNKNTIMSGSRRCSSHDGIEELVSSIAPERSKDLVRPKHPHFHKLHVGVPRGSVLMATHHDT